MLDCAAGQLPQIWCRNNLVAKVSLRTLRTARIVLVGIFLLYVMAGGQMVICLGGAPKNQNMERLPPNSSASATARISTTVDIYAQIVPAGQRRALEQLSEFAERVQQTHGPFRSNKKDFSMLKSGCQCRQVAERFGGASRARTDGLVVANDGVPQFAPVSMRVP